MSGVIEAAMEALVERIVERKLEERLARVGAGSNASAPALMGVPDAAKLTGIGQDAIREWIAAGLIPRRLKGCKLNPKRPTYLVALDEIRDAAERRGGMVSEPSQEKTIDLEERARALLARSRREG